MKTTNELIAAHQALLSQPYGKRRNAQLWKIQTQLERRGIFNRGGQLVRSTRARNVRDFQHLSAA